MSSAIKHFSHPEHELILKENDVIEDTATCYVCSRTVIGFPTYTCTSHAAHDDDDVRCKHFYLHQTCAKLPPRIFPHNMHSRHRLTLKRRSGRYYCDGCHLQIKFAYGCDPCGFGLCVACAFPCPPDDDEQRELHHEGHQEHTLVLLQRQALFKCDACWVEAKDFSYVCKTCDFWIHKKCALSPPIIAEPANHHHPLHLIFSIPDEHRYFSRWCNICGDYVPVISWIYYCHKCTYFVHMKCATAPALNETEVAGSDNDPGLIEFPLHSLEAISDFMTTRFSISQVDFEGEHKDTAMTSTRPNDPHIIEKHWSHPDHPLQLFQLIINEHDNDDEDDDNTTPGLICDGCIQPITATHPSYYSCTRCNFFLHSVCATNLPDELPIGVSTFHPQHPLVLSTKIRFYVAAQCGVCGCLTNGFYYKCEACDIRIDICCAFLPSRIKYKSHKHHSFILRSSSDDICNVSRYLISGGMEYGCEICNSFRISVPCVFYPSTMKHKYDDHPITLRYPPFFYEGAFYCELCEERVNNQWWLYHCDKSDHSFHANCLILGQKLKLGGTIRIHDNNDEMHTLALVFKRNVRTNSPLYMCGYCGDGFTHGRFFECGGCGYLICVECGGEMMDCELTSECSSDS
ncbi:hypothetical protein DCAR_0207001 [Daucus carota subsp. sativus]|uniref:DC1 domain-containing protein n=1 Tax=Daucus carota subsp. sativus TaxID=79200 RepID=A0AAF0WD78_DAUCS|nr:PREDICTED: uncharacterized protein LOC108207520 [Daucus carota subsp. sativus]WOG87770.1 hypothetical protein DCAR_0207001 [Daucus carota subsp. sativus]